MQNFIIALSTIRLIPHIFLFYFSKNTKIIQYDLQRWIEIKQLKISSLAGFIRLMTFYPEFRNLFYYRIGGISLLINCLCPKVSTLFLRTPQIGPGLYIQHGFATSIGARIIGKDCWINQQVTIGYTNIDDCPTIGDNVTVSAGAIVLGNHKIGNNSIIGANAVVVKDVPANCTVAGVPAKIIRRDGKRIDEELK